jgi:hypothetical protein
LPEDLCFSVIMTSEAINDGGKASFKFNKSFLSCGNNIDNLGKLSLEICSSKVCGVAICSSKSSFIETCESKPGN